MMLPRKLGRVSISGCNPALQLCDPGGPDGEEHTGLTDDDDEGEPDYDVASRMTLKASSEAFLEVGELHGFVG
jgi:hypothetical protein